MVGQCVNSRLNSLVMGLVWVAGLVLGASYLAQCCDLIGSMGLWS